VARVRLERVGDPPEPPHAEVRVAVGGNFRPKAGRLGPGEKDCQRDDEHERRLEGTAARNGAEIHRVRQ
jgi:hypothetical protein